MRTRTGPAAPPFVALLALALVLLAVPAGAAPTLETQVLRATSMDSVYTQPSVAKLVNQQRLAYAARTASHAADGAPIKVVFVGVSNRRLNLLRDRLFEQLDLRPSGALVVATPTAVTIRTQTLTRDQENGIVALDAHLFGHRAGYTEPLAELVYDVGLVIHNSRPGVAPRGSGRDRNLATFTGAFPDERQNGRRAEEGGRDWVLPVAIGWLAAALAGLTFYALSRRRRPSG
jgi:hypothetical protein